MKERVAFNNNSDRVRFFHEVLKASGLRFWKQLYEHLKIPKSRFEFYKNGNSTIPFSRYFQLILLLPKEKQDYYKNKIKFIDQHWGQRKGGIVTSQKHKEIFNKGRKFSWKNREALNVSFQLNEALCEVIGVHIGDGFTNKYGSRYVVQFSGHSIFDFDYYKDFVIPTIFLHFKRKPDVRKIENTLRITYYSKEIHIFLTKRMHFPAGKKTFTVTIPKEILQLEKKCVTAVLRGIYNADGCVFFDKRPVYRRAYPRVHIKLSSKQLINQIYDLLASFGLNPTITKDRKVIQINGAKYVKKFLKTIGFSNPRHLNRIRGNYPELLE